MQPPQTSVPLIVSYNSQGLSGLQSEYYNSVVHAGRRSREHHSDLQSHVAHISIYHLGDHNLMTSSSKTLCRHCFDCFCSPLAITKCFCRLISTVPVPVATRTPKIDIKEHLPVPASHFTDDFTTVFAFWCVFGFLDIFAFPKCVSVWLFTVKLCFSLKRVTLNSYFT